MKMVMSKNGEIPWIEINDTRREFTPPLLVETGDVLVVPEPVERNVQELPLPKPREWFGMLQELLSNDSDLMSTNEVGFILSLDAQMEQYGEGWSPSVKQLEFLNEIWATVFEG